MYEQIKKPIALALGATLIGGLSLSASAFAMTDLSQGYLLGAQSAQSVDKAGAKAVAAKKVEGSCGGDKKHGEGGCGGAKSAGKPIAKKAGEGKCGEGKCGGDKKGAVKSSAKPTAKKAGEGKCGEGKCGGSV
ncbi:HvfA family oxazolone/thioamide-modified RiPP metallophore [Lysobacter firmicutimachus]|uniref:Low-complexity protein n=1 Tax=Lysobacter firmicutimachus TaxID=1792846 RepID=A0ABU8D3B8_9GAMM